MSHMHSTQPGAVLETDLGQNQSAEQDKYPGAAHLASGMGFLYLTVQWGDCSRRGDSYSDVPFQTDTDIVEEVGELVLGSPLLSTYI